ncbi:MAG: hypothetical protein V1891_04915 [bacterium]
MKKANIRKAKMDDLQAVVRLDHEVWPEEVWASEDMYRTRFATYLDGTFVAISDKKVVGIVVTQRMDYNIVAPIPTWAEATDNGFMKNSHNPNGGDLYGIALTVHQKAPRNTGALLLEAVRIFIIANNFRQIFIGSRVPLYYKHEDQFSIEEYVHAKNNHGRYLDPELELYISRADLKFIKALPDYFEDPSSLNYGVLLVWQNPFYGKVFTRHWKNLVKI